MFLRFVLPGFLLLTGLHALWTAYFRPYDIHSDYDQTRRRNLRITAWSLIACAVLVSGFFFLIGGL